VLALIVSALLTTRPAIVRAGDTDNGGVASGAVVRGSGAVDPAGAAPLTPATRPVSATSGIAPATSQPATLTPSTRVAPPNRSAADEVQLHRGLLSLERGELGPAADRFNALAGARPSDADVRALQEVTAAQSRAEQDRQLEGELSLGYEYVSTLVILGRPIGPPRSDTHFQGATLDLNLDATVYQRDAVRVGVHTTDFLTGIFYQGDDVADLGNFEYVGSYQVGPDVDFALSQQDHLGLAYDLQCVTIPPATHWGATRSAVTASFTHIEPLMGATTVSYQYAQERYSDFFNQQRDVFGVTDNGLYSTGGNVHAIGLSQTFNLPKLSPRDARGPQVEVGVSYQRQDTGEAVFEADVYGVYAILRTPLPWLGLTFDVGGRFVYSEYDEPITFGDPRRNDNEVAVSAGLTKFFSEHLACRVETEYLKHGSNALDDVPPFDPYEFDSYTVAVRMLYVF
jgi:hypothetical protein